MAKKVVIVGGVAGGATTAARLRRLDEQTEIVMIERGEYISFANCGLPYYIAVPSRSVTHCLFRLLKACPRNSTWTSAT
ncbi:CoA-disulfide reductase [Mesobacillus boroniphilus JCM 21738]|uniref:CoA-disulfide reductase n=1 Tax=Mesobacillus boroniphilus JCM 21738 TaxID=1294265 RepID=W4RIR9_9BACI|nr:CoA-disulfide reductase [Mesobacillus boroniphilus JCM 21738]